MVDLEAGGEEVTSADSGGRVGVREDDDLSVGKDESGKGAW